MTEIINNKEIENIINEYDNNFESEIINRDNNNIYNGHNLL